MKTRFTIGIAFILASFFAFTACKTTVTRWSDYSEEKGDRTISYEKKKNIFTDFLWTTPPVYSKKLEFKDTRATVDFNGKKLELLLNDDKSMTLLNDELKTTTDIEMTPKNCYYNIDILGTKIVERERYVSESEWVTKTVSVPKSRTVPKTVPVTKTRSIYDSFSKTSRTETYTDWETRFETEFYTDFETRRVLETVYRWKTVQESFINIPSYAAFSFNTKSGDRLLIYKIRDQGKDTYYFQNASYIYSTEKQVNFFGVSSDLAMLFIDTNANGYYFDDDDMILYNSWNPYSKDSAYMEIRTFMDNSWYRIAQLKLDYFITFSADSEAAKLEIKNANSAFIKSTKKGTITITNVIDDMKVIINGQEYYSIKNGIFSSDIEYGYFKLRVTKPRYLDFVKTFTVDDSSQTVSIPYEKTAPAGTFTVKNLGFRNWKLALKNEKGDVYNVYNENSISVKAGTYAINIIGNNIDYGISLTIEPGEVFEYDFATDKVEKIANKALDTSS